MLLEWFIPVFAGLLGGWLVNYLADVLPNTRRLSTAECHQCHTPYSTTDYLLLRACRNCNARRTTRTWTFQVVLLGLSIYTWIHPNIDLHYWVGFVLLIYFATVFVIDVEHRLILHPTSIVGSLLALTAGLLRNSPGETLLGGLGGFAIMYTFYLLGLLFAKSRTRRRVAAGLPTDDEEALGFGDVILAGILGLALGWPLIAVGLFLGVLLGGAASIMAILVLAMNSKLREKAWEVFLPYGPYFILAASLFLYFPDLFR